MKYIKFANGKIEFIQSIEINDTQFCCLTLIINGKARAYGSYEDTNKVLTCLTKYIEQSSKIELLDDLLYDTSFNG